LAKIPLLLLTINTYILKTLQLNPLLRSGSIILIGIALSIGWGIRGNFGHEYGAAFAGSLAAIATAILSSRDDWRDKVGYFALFGAIGWGFGASQSYMQVIAYTQSGHAASQWYGFLSLFYMGFLWAALGGAGTAFAAVETSERISKFIKPLLFVFGMWLILDIIEDPLASWLEDGAKFDGTWSRHKNPLYWFDSDYLAAIFALAGVGLYDLWDRKDERNRLLMPLFAFVGAFAGWMIQALLRMAGMENKFGSSLTFVLGDPTYINPETGRQAFDASNMLNNWPVWFGDYPQHIGWITGLFLGIVAYFYLFGKLRNGASLIAYMSIGFLLAFLALPVLGSLFFQQYGGIRMTPPRSDSWAGITGVFAGTSLWMWKNNLRPVAVASLISGTIGGLGFAGVQFIKQVMTSFGSTKILENKGILPGSEEYTSVVRAWSNWQGQNWHSFLEQSYGFVNGVAIAIALGFLVTRMNKGKDDTVPDPGISGSRWTRAFSVLVILLGLTYFNVFKNVQVWSEQLNPKIWVSVVQNADGTKETVPAQWDAPYIGRLPGVDFLHLSPSGWFNLTWALLVIGCVIIVKRHYRSPLPLIPKKSLAKGQLIFLLLLWIMVIANFERALTGWAPGRLLTEWMIFVHSILATVLVLLLPREQESISLHKEEDLGSFYRRLWIKTIAIAAISSVIFFAGVRMIYQYPDFEKINYGGNQTRFGPKATWKTSPIMKNGEHK
jgi:hypothetical protein